MAKDKVIVERVTDNELALLVQNYDALVLTPSALTANQKLLWSALHELQQNREEFRVQIHGLCDKHKHIGHFPAQTATLPMPPIDTVCPWCSPNGGGK